MASLYVLTFTGAEVKDLVIFDNLKEATDALNKLYELTKNIPDFSVEVFDKSDSGKYVSTGNYIKCELV
jgi:hypothetical protein